MAEDKHEQSSLFDSGKWWEKEWRDMPEYVQHDIMPWHSIKIHFLDRTEMEKFSKFIDQKITKTTQSIWYPKLEKQSFSEKVYIDES